MTNIGIDVATVLAIGAREVQQDSLIVDFPVGSDVGFLALADGMGGHSSGEIASNIVVTELFAELKFKLNDLAEFEERLPSVLRHAAMVANDGIRDFVAEHPDNYGMGATLVAAIVVDNRFYWISIGDSPMYLWRDGKLQQLNEDHSLAPEIDLMIRNGVLSEEQGKNHPGRSALRSVLFGADIAKIDCPDKPLSLLPGDIIIVASDGLQSLNESEIEYLVTKNDEGSNEVAYSLLSAIVELDDPEQDNVSMSVLKITKAMMAQDAEGAPILELGNKESQPPKAAAAS